MAAPNLATFKYQHRDRVAPPLVGLAVFLLVLAVLGYGIYSDNGFVIFLAIAGGVVASIKWPKRNIALGPRYLLCGNTLIYYANVRRMELTPGRELVLHWGDKNVFKLERNRFPTNARKTPKIEKNKTAKFQKVSGKIIERVEHAAPAAKLVRKDN